MSKLDKVKTETLLSYIHIIISMETCRLVDIDIYKIAEKKRSLIHDEILKQAETTRDDQVFSFELAKYVEGFRYQYVA